MKKNLTVHGIIVAAALAVVVGLTTGGAYHRVGPTGYYPPAYVTGALNADVTQSNIQKTICTNGYTATIRPPVSYTNKLKAAQLMAMVEAGELQTPVHGSDFEEDHFISLELGGNPTDPANLWPEAYATSSSSVGARQKDQVEDFLRHEVCSGHITLAAAQQAVVKDWYAIYIAGKGVESASSVDPSDQ